jgi:hypothetical protein
MDSPWASEGIQQYATAILIAVEKHFRSATKETSGPICDWPLVARQVCPSWL